MAYLYKISNKVNKKVYVGITGNPRKRFLEHMSPSSGCVKLAYAVAKHGKENFYMAVLCSGNRETVIKLEAAAIKYYNSMEEGYNVLPADPSLMKDMPEHLRHAIARPFKVYRETNEPHNKGDYMNTPEDNVPHYVSGFWFPTAGIASKTLRMKPETIKKRRELGTLGDTKHIRVDSLDLIPVYVGGFWFPNVNVAAKALNKHRATLLRYIKNGHQEQGVPRKDITGKNNPMSGRTGGSNPNARAVSVLGQEFPSLADAVRATGFTKSMLGKRLKKGVEGFHYLDNKHLQGE